MKAEKDQPETTKETPMKQITRLSPDQLQRLKSLVDEAMLQQSLRNARNRNRIARLVFSNPKWRWVALWETGTVRTWWDPRTRNYITASWARWERSWGRTSRMSAPTAPIARPSVISGFSTT